MSIFEIKYQGKLAKIDATHSVNNSCDGIFPPYPEEFGDKVDAYINECIAEAFPDFDEFSDDPTEAEEKGLRCFFDDVRLIERAPLPDVRYIIY